MLPLFASVVHSANSATTAADADAVLGNPVSKGQSSQGADIAVDYSEEFQACRLAAIAAPPAVYPAGEEEPPGAFAPVLLSLFDGTGSATKPFVEAGWRVYRLDIDGSHGADIVADILNWDPRDWHGPCPDVIIAGPPCEHLSIARTRSKIGRNISLAKLLLTKTLDVIDFFHGRNENLQYAVENPDTSMMWGLAECARLYGEPRKYHPPSIQCENGDASPTTSRRAKLRELSYSDSRVVRLDYCQYGTLYRKRTRFMTNNPWPAKPLCSPKDVKCMSVDPTTGCHYKTAQQGPGRLKGGKLRAGDICTRDELHAYPRALVEEMYLHFASNLSRPHSGLTPSTVPL